MDNISSKEGHFDIDLEKGRLSGELSSSGRLVFGPIRMKPLYSEPINTELGGSNGLSKVEEGEVLSVVSNCGDGLGNVKSIVVVDKKEGEERSGGVSEKKQVREKPKAMSAKKPPRPPRGLSLDSADQKLIRELHELAKLKRARIERMKALKKAKEAKASSSKNHLFATLLTVLFGLVLLFQGISSRTNSGANFHASPIPSGATESSVISIQQHPVPSTSNVNGPEYKSPRRVERVSGFDTRERVNSAVG